MADDDRLGEYTEHLGLYKPDGEDLVDIGDINGNMDTIDAAIEYLDKHAHCSVVYSENPVEEGGPDVPTLTFSPKDEGEGAESDSVTLNVPYLDENGHILSRFFDKEVVVEVFKVSSLEDSELEQAQVPDMALIIGSGNLYVLTDIVETEVEGVKKKEYRWILIHTDNPKFESLEVTGTSTFNGAITQNSDKSATLGTVTAGATTVDSLTFNDNDLKSKVIVTDEDGKIAASSVVSISELNALDGIGNTTIRAQLDAEKSARQEADSVLTTDLGKEVDERVSEISRVEGLITAEAARATTKEGEIANALADEEQARLNGDATLQSNIEAEQNRAEGVENSHNTRIMSIEGKIPSAATSTNQLADKGFVNSSISTNTANFLGTFDVENDLELPTSATHDDVKDKLNSRTWATPPTANDYVFVFFDYEGELGKINRYDRYKYSTSWAYEYTLNNSSFTAVQWATINSNIVNSGETGIDVKDLNAHLANGDIHVTVANKSYWNAKVDTVSTSGNSGYVSAISRSGDTLNVTKTAFANATQSAAGLMSKEDKSKLDHVAEYAEVNVQSNWTETNVDSDAFIKNKPAIKTAWAQTPSNTDVPSEALTKTSLDGKAPTSHASNQTTYGVSSASNYGHAKASSTSPKMDGTAAVGNETTSFARGDHVHPTDATRASQSDFTAHTNNTNNPHGVTKVQLGLANVDDTHDVDKPISAATQNALNNKVDKLSTSPAGNGFVKVNVNAQGQVTGHSAMVEGDIPALSISKTSGLQSAIDSKLTIPQVVGPGAENNEECYVVTTSTSESLPLPSGVSTGSDHTPIKIVNGTAVAVAHTLMDLDTAQTITARKTFSVGNQGFSKLSTQNPNLRIKPSASNWFDYLDAKDSDGTRIVQHRAVLSPTDNRSQIIVKDENNVQKFVAEFIASSEKGAYVTGNTPAEGVSTAFTTKAFVQATDGRNNLVHNIGDEEIRGTKRRPNATIHTFAYGNNSPMMMNPNVAVSPDEYQEGTAILHDINAFRILDKDSVEIEKDYVRKTQNGWISEKWFSFVGTDNVTYHPSLQITFNNNTKLAILNFCGVEVARKQF